MPGQEEVRDTRHRRKQLQISEDLLILLFSEGVHNPVEIIKDAVPKDARIVGARYDGFSNTATFLLESSEFPELKEGGQYPNLTPVALSRPDTGTEAVKLEIMKKGFDFWLSIDAGGKKALINLGEYKNDTIVGGALLKAMEKQSRPDTGEEVERARRKIYRATPKEHFQHSYPNGVPVCAECDRQVSEDGKTGHDSDCLVGFILSRPSQEGGR